MNHFLQQVHDGVISPLNANQALMVIAVGVISLTAIVLLTSVAVFIHHIFSDRNRRRNRQRFEAAASFLAPAMVAGDGALKSHVQQARVRFGDRAVSLVLRRSRYDIKGEAAEAITEALRDMGAIDALLRELRSRRDWKRSTAARGLGECGGEEARKALSEAAFDQVGEVRRAAREGLLADGTPDAIHTAIHSFLEDLPRRAGWRKSFYARLASVAPNALLELIEDQKLNVTEEKLALEALGDSASPDALPLAIARVNAAEPEMRATAVRVIGKLGGGSALHLVINALSDPAWFVRAAGARSLEWMFGARKMAAENPAEANRALDDLAGRLVDGSWWVRANAARALSQSGERGIDLLFSASESNDAYARDASLAALAMTTLEPPQRQRLEAIVARLLAAKPLEKRATTPVIDFGLGATT